MTPRLPQASSTTKAKKIQAMTLMEDHLTIRAVRPTVEGMIVANLRPMVEDKVLTRGVEVGTNHMVEIKVASHTVEIKVASHTVEIKVTSHTVEIKVASHTAEIKVASPMVEVVSLTVIKVVSRTVEIIQDRIPPSILDPSITKGVVEITYSEHVADNSLREEGARVVASSKRQSMVKHETYYISMHKYSQSDWVLSNGISTLM